MANFIKNDNGRKILMSFKNGTTSRVYESGRLAFSQFPDDLYFKYEEDETNRPLINDRIPKEQGDFNLPEGMFSMLVSNGDIKFLDETGNTILSFNDRLEKYLSENFKEHVIGEARMTFLSLIRLTSEQYIIDNYFEKETENG